MELVMSERVCKYCLCSNEPNNKVYRINQENICETCIKISADIAKEMGAIREK